MTERTVTVQTEQEETITLCDHCGLSDDAGEIVTYKVSQADSSGVENVRDYDSLDLHKHCLDEFGVEVPEGPTFADEFAEQSELDSPPIVAFTKDDIMINGFLMAVFGIPGTLALLDGDLIGLLPLAFVAILLLATIAEGHSTAQETIEELKA